MNHLSALVTLLTVLLLAACMYVVGRSRVKYAIKAPAVSGHPAFERAYRVQMNTLEGTMMFLPTLWLATLYGFGLWAGSVGLLWIAARVWYALAYWRDPAQRGPGYALGMLAWAVTLVLAGIGVSRALLVA